MIGEGDVNAMARAMLRLVNDTGLAKELGQRGREFVSRRHQMSVSIERLASILAKSAQRPAS